VFPNFPPKRPNTLDNFIFCLIYNKSSNDPSTIDERIKCFNSLLKFLVKKNLISDYFLLFIQPIEKIPYFGKFEVMAFVHLPVNIFFCYKKEISPSASEHLSFWKKNVSNTSAEKMNIFGKGLLSECKEKITISDDNTSNSLNFQKNKRSVQNYKNCCFDVIVKESHSHDTDTVKGFKKVNHV